MEFDKAELRLLSYAVQQRLNKINATLYVIDYVIKNKQIYGWQREILPEGLRGLPVDEIIEQYSSWKTLQESYDRLLSKIGKPNTIG